MDLLAAGKSGRGAALLGPVLGKSYGWVGDRQVTQGGGKGGTGAVDSKGGMIFGTSTAGEVTVGRISRHQHGAPR